MVVLQVPRSVLLLALALHDVLATVAVTCLLLSKLLGRPLAEAVLIELSKAAETQLLFDA